MVRNTHIILRTAAESKQRLTEAARKKGMTLSTFILDAAEKMAKATARHPTLPHFRGVPTYYRMSCLEARRGGRGGYRSAGYNLALHLAAQPPYGMEEQEWQERLEELRELLGEEARDDEKILAWFATYYPRCLDLVPRRRHEQFLRGVYAAFAEDRIALEV